MNKGNETRSGNAAHARKRIRSCCYTVFSSLTFCPARLVTASRLLNTTPPLFSCLLVSIPQPNCCWPSNAEHFCSVLRVPFLFLFCDDSLSRHTPRFTSRSSPWSSLPSRLQKQKILPDTVKSRTEVQKQRHEHAENACTQILCALTGHEQRILCLDLGPFVGWRIARFMQKEFVQVYLYKHRATWNEVVKHLRAFASLLLVVALSC